MVQFSSMIIARRIFALAVIKILIESTQGQTCKVDYPWTFKGPNICFVVTNFIGKRAHARQHCRSLNANIYLPTMKDIDTLNFVSRGLKQMNMDHHSIWVAVYKSGANYFWFDGTPLLLNDSKWHVGEPNGNGNCVSMWTKTKTVNGITFRTLDDTLCTESKLTICSCKTVNYRKPNAAEKLFKDSPSLGPYQDEYLKSTASGANPVLELEKVGLKAATDLLNSNQTDVTETVQTDIMKMQISKFSVSRFTGQFFTSIGDKSSLQLPESAFQVANASAVYAATVGIAYSKIESDNELNNQASFENSSIKWKLDSDVISFTVVYAGLNLTNPVVLTFQSEREKESQEQSTCAFWNTSSNSWSQEGCYKMTNASDVTTCHCYHLTTFASLMQVIPDPENQFTESELFTIDLITYICFGLSYVGNIITIASFIVSRTLTKPSNFIHFNLCIAILFAQSTFLSGIKSTENKSICKFIAVLLHYLYLAVGCWMFVEGLYILRMTKRIFNTSRNVLGYCVIGWGIPALLVIVLFPTLHKSYGYDQACWLTKNNGAIWAFAGPMILIIMFNIVVLVVAIRATLNIRMNRTKTEREKIGVGIKAVVILLPLLGLNWVFGLLAIGSAAKAMQIVFAIANGLQGFFIFIFHCVRNPEVKNGRLFTRQTYNSASVKNKVFPSRSTTGAASAKKNQPT